MSKSLWELQQEGKEVVALNPTDLLYLLRDPQTGRFDRVIAAESLLALLGGSAEIVAHLNDLVGAHAASAISFIPTGTIQASNVQAAIAEAAAEVPAGVTDGDKGDITVTGGVWSIDANAVGTAKIADSNITNAKLANVNTNTVKGRVAAGSGVVQDLTPVNARTVLASDSGGGTVNFLRADATWAPAGTNIINGIGPPNDDIGSGGDYYLDESTDILYGPKVLASYPNQVAEWAGPHTGAMTGGYTFGMRCIFARAGEVRGVNLFIPTGYESSGYDFTLSLWTIAGVRLASKVKTTGWVINSWNQVLFDAPIAVTAASVYLVSYHNAAVRISSASGVFPVEGVTSGDIQIPTNTESPNQSVYGSGDVFPNNAFWPTTEPVSPIFRQTAGTIWPVAIGVHNYDAMYVNTSGGDSMAGPLTVVGNVNVANVNASGRLEINGGVGASPSYVQDLYVMGGVIVEGTAEFTNTVTLDANPTLPLQAATKQYVDSNVGNEVFVGPGDPGTPYELWYDTDEPAVLINDLRWNTAWGNLGTHQLTSIFSTSGTHTVAQDEGLTLTINDVAGRRYKFTLTLNPYVPGGSTGIRYRLLRNGVLIREWTLSPVQLSTSGAFSLTFTHEMPISVAASGVVYKLTCNANPNNVQVASWADPVGFPRQLIIEDVGPVSGSVPAPDPTPAWITPTFTNGWQNYGSGFTIAQYRKIGDIVYLRGMVRNGTIGAAIFVLPSGYCPIYQHIFIARSNDAAGDARVNVAGNVIPFAGSNIWFSLDGIQFSVT